MPALPAPRFVDRVPFDDALRVWSRVALLSFGGPAGQIAVMHRILVEEKRYVGEQRFLHALNFCMLLPGPEAQQLATYLGWLLNGWRGGLVAGALFVLPGFLAILALSIVYAQYQGTMVVSALFFGLKPAVMAIVIDALLRIGRRALRGTHSVLLAAAAFVAMNVFRAPFAAVILCAALLGFAGGRMWPEREADAAVSPHASGRPPAPELADDDLEIVHRSWRRTLVVAAGGLAAWWLPILLLALGLGGSHVFVQVGVFFSKVAVVSFGGAYAVLTYVAQEAVQTFHWLRPGEMLDGLGMAETTPGPLIMVVQFVGYMAAYRHPGGLGPAWAGVIGSIVVTWVTFVPCFLWIFLGGPYIERLRRNRALRAALAGVTAAVVGVILNLAVWFGAHVLFGRVGEGRLGAAHFLLPDPTTLNVAALLIGAGAFVAMMRFRWGPLSTLLAGTVAGAVWVIVRS